jgi:hypothetical protein
MDSILCVVYVLAVLAVAAWLLYELRADKRDQARYESTVPRDRFPPKDGP